MNIHKVINNNVISAFDEQNQEVVIMGRGIGFKAKSGDVINESKIEKVFHMENHSMSKKFQDMLSDMPMEYMEISNDIIAYAKDCYDMKLNQSIYLALTDHISFAVQRYHKGVQLENALLGELKQAYDQEYKVGKYAIGLLKEQLGVEFSEHEAGFIALHFVNAKREF